MEKIQFNASGEIIMPMKMSELEEGVIGKLKGKFEIDQTSRGHIYYEISYKGKKVVETHRSHGSGGKEIFDDILSKIKRQLRLDNVKQLHDLKNCPMSAEDYVDLLKQKHVISD